MRRWGIYATLALVAPAMFAGVAAADIVLRERFPFEGHETQLIIQNADGVPVPGATVTVTYRPGSSVEKSDEVGTAGEGGALSWTPATAGIATLSASWTADDGTESSISTNVSVRFASVPFAGVIIMIFAGVLLVGGSFWRIRRILTS